MTDGTQTQATKHPGGRPTDYTQELADIICEELAMGKSMRTVCKKEGMPDMSTVFRWIRKDEEFCKQYARAKEESADAMGEEVLDIADDSINDYNYSELVPGVELNAENIQRSRLRIETRKWLMSKMKPKKYSDKLDVTSDGKQIKGNAIIFKQFDGTSD